MRRVFDRLLIVLFLGALVAPGVDSLLRPEERMSVLIENRKPEPFPELEPTLASLNALPSNLERWYGDALGLREWLLRCHHRVRMQLFGVSPSEQVRLGQRGWIFPRDMDMLAVSLGRLKLSPGRLELWRRALESRRDFCEAHGAEYVVAIAPEKGSIYPELLPNGLAPFRPTPLDQLVGWLERRSDMRILDLRELMLAEKAKDHDGDFAYYPLGTHWTDRAGYAVYARLLDRLCGRFPTLSPTPLSALHWQVSASDGDSWAERLHMQGILHQHAELTVEIERDFDCEVGFVEARKLYGCVRGPDPAAPRLLLYYDSFGERLRKLFANHFSECWFEASPDFDPGLVRRERPDVVMQIFAERNLLRQVPEVVLESGLAGLQRAFESAELTLFSLDIHADPPQVISVGKSRILRVEEGLVIEQPDALDMIELPAFDYPKDAVGLMRLEIISPRASYVTVLYKTQEVTTYRRGHSYGAAASAGASTMYIQMTDPKMKGALRLRLSQTGGTITIRSLAVRAFRFTPEHSVDDSTQSNH